jgi:hypothetical protein
VSGRGQRARRRIVAGADLARGLAIPHRRGARFAARRQGAPTPRLGLAEFRAWPRWPTLSDARQQRVWALAALLAGRDALADAIDGGWLRAYAAHVGDAVLDAVLDLPPGGDRPLPAADDLVSRGRELARSGLPPMLADAMGLSRTDDPTAARFVAQAEQMLGARA